MRDCVAVSNFEELLAEADAEPADGWSFDWFEGRATETRPSWGYAKLLSQRMECAFVALDLQTGGGEVLATIAKPPPRLVATESWLPNLEIAHKRLVPFGALVVATSDDMIPFASSIFDLVVSRHPVQTPWAEISRVLAPGGSFLSQQVGAGSNRELTDFFMGPQVVGDGRRAERHVEYARSFGLEVIDLRQETLTVTFSDVGAVAYFLRKVLWTVPGFSVNRYRNRLKDVHDWIEREGAFVAHSERFLIEARKL